MSDQVKQFLDVPRDFVKDGAFFLNRCTKPSKRGMCPCAKMDLRTQTTVLTVEFLEISRAVAVGFLVMGFIGFFVKLVHIPINNILVRLVRVMLIVGGEELSGSGWCGGECRVRHLYGAQTIITRFMTEKYWYHLLDVIA